MNEFRRIPSERVLRLYNLTKKPVNIVEKLKSEGHKAYYSIDGVNVVEYPDGSVFRVELINNNPVEVAPYEP
ncbi:hypothetical protein [Oligella urethralis]|uniref:Uncharacterized protein n=1 Tax=Oligella urethralis TaxID=90245 RepID=A0A2N6QF67_9BURK|nr:hypothetical protein [Oligella urethralis]PMC18211.1 hypothetical protein CJ230_03650 [Oligella urethralis]SPY09121.1 Uncharacterised protein [Oligella urethralis]